MGKQTKHNGLKITHIAQTNRRTYDKQTYHSDASSTKTSRQSLLLNTLSKTRSPDIWASRRSSMDWKSEIEMVFLIGKSCVLAIICHIIVKLQRSTVIYSYPHCSGESMSLYQKCEWRISTFLHQIHIQISYIHIQIPPTSYIGFILRSTLWLLKSQYRWGYYKGTLTLLWQKAERLLCMQ